MTALAGAVQALGPLTAAVFAVVPVLVTGFDQHSALPAVIEARFYGFFLDRYPLFAAAIVYGMARIILAMVQPGAPCLARRLLGGGVAVILLLGASLYPTFGGVILRSAFATGGVAFLGQQSMGTAYALGTAAGAVVFGLVLGGSRLMVAGRTTPGGGWRHRLIRGGAHVLIRYLSVWFALAILGLAHAIGFGAWPRRPLTGADAMWAALLVLVAFLPHAFLDLFLFPTDSKSGRALHRPVRDGLIPTA